MKARAAILVGRAAFAGERVGGGFGQFKVSKAAARLPHSKHCEEGELAGGEGIQGAEAAPNGLLSDDVDARAYSHLVPWPVCCTYCGLQSEPERETSAGGPDFSRRGAGNFFFFTSFFEQMLGINRGLRGLERALLGLGCIGARFGVRFVVS